MSGGRFDYLDLTLKNEIFNGSDKPINVFEDRVISELVWDVLNLIHEYDWYASGDTSKTTYLKRKSEFKIKWWSDQNTRVRQTIDTAIRELRDELYETFDIGEAYDDV